MLPIDYNALVENLRLTQVYCEQQLANTDKNMAQILRSINPGEDGKPFFDIPTLPEILKSGLEYYSTSWMQPPYSDGVINPLFAEQLTHKEDYTRDSDLTVAIQGKIFAYKINETLSDGAACAESMGAIDDYNCPPIDTWFYIVPGNSPLLLAWIPGKFVHLFQNGIDVNPEECIHWFEHWYPDEHMRIWEMGLIADTL